MCCAGCAAECGPLQSIASELRSRCGRAADRCLFCPDFIFQVVRTRERIFAPGTMTTAGARALVSRLSSRESMANSHASHYLISLMITVDSAARYAVLHAFLFFTVLSIFLCRSIKTKTFWEKTLAFYGSPFSRSFMVCDGRRG